jgi:hypothetical protein
MRKVRFVAVIGSMFAFGWLPSGASVKPGTHTPVPLIVTVNACDPMVVSEICGDGSEQDELGRTTYTDGQDGVRATIDQYGNLIIDFQTTRAKIRGLVYKYGASSSAPPGGGSNHYLSTIGGTALQALPPSGTTIKTSCPLYDDDSGQPQYRHSFSRDCQGGFGSEGSPLMVTRTGEGTWTIVPTEPATARVFSITTKGRVQVQDLGDFGLPFTMTLTAKQ